MGFISKDMFFLLMGIFILTLYGGVTYWIGLKKGYKGVRAALWFFIGFFLLLIGIIIAIKIPEWSVKEALIREKREKKEMEEKDKKMKEIVMHAAISNSWVCRYCGTKNFGYVGTCACGKTKQESVS